MSREQRARVAVVLDGLNSLLLRVIEDLTCLGHRQRARVERGPDLGAITVGEAREGHGPAALDEVVEDLGAHLA